MNGDVYCLQCGNILFLKAVPENPENKNTLVSEMVTACACCGSRAFNVPGNKIKELTAQRDELLAALKEVVYCSENFGKAYAGRDARDKAKALIKRIDHA